MRLKFLVGWIVTWQIAQTYYTGCVIDENKWTGDQIYDFCLQSKTIDMELKFADEKGADDFIATKPPDTDKTQFINVEKKEDK